MGGINKIDWKGCICSKGKSADQYVAENHAKDRSSNTKHLRLGGRELTENDATAHLISNANAIGHGNGTEEASTSSDEHHQGDKNVNANATEQSPQPKVCRIFSVTGGERGGQVLTGWPSWLTAVAGEAISGWIPRRADSFEKLDKASPPSFLLLLFFTNSNTNHSFFLSCCRLAKELTAVFIELVIS